MDTTGTFEMAEALSEYKLLTAISKHYTLEQWVNFARKSPTALPYAAISLGTSKENFEITKSIVKEVPDINIICLDIANGYCEPFLAAVQQLRDFFPEKIIIAGNVVTPDQATRVLEAGADIIKLGIGGGSVCTTSRQTGVGLPQLSCILECESAIRSLKGISMSDGGITNAGDLCKAFGAGAGFVMMGGMLAGHTESGGEIVKRDGQQFKRFYGMSSGMAMEKYYGGIAYYRSS